MAKMYVANYAGIGQALESWRDTINGEAIVSEPRTQKQNASQCTRLLGV